MRATTAAALNPFALMMDPGRVRRMIDGSEQLSRLRLRKCHPLDKAVIRCASAELAAYDARIDRTTVYLPPEEESLTVLVRSLPQSVN